MNQVTKIIKQQIDSRLDVVLIELYEDSSLEGEPIVQRAQYLY